MRAKRGLVREAPGANSISTLCADTSRWNAIGRSAAKTGASCTSISRVRAQASSGAQSPCWPPGKCPSTSLAMSVDLWSSSLMPYIHRSNAPPGTYDMAKRTTPPLLGSASFAAEWATYRGMWLCMRLRAALSIWSSSASNVALAKPAASVHVMTFTATSSPLASCSRARHTTPNAPRPMTSRKPNWRPPIVNVFPSFASGFEGCSSRERAAKDALIGEAEISW
mmetsp:Transcript_20554/g.53956  ORF Transcript_20554/g.53956 Transcript_20554/m.53956 type:complete len:224 (-) Transcript_20554:1331-2002(-)